MTCFRRTKLEALLKSISVTDDAELEVLRKKALERLYQARFLRPALIPILPRRDDETISKPDEPNKDAPIFLDDPSASEETKDGCYKALLRISWLAPSIRSAILTHLGKSAARREGIAARVQTDIDQSTIEQFKKDWPNERARYEEKGLGKAPAPFDRFVILTNASIKKWKKFSVKERNQIDKKIKALRQRLWRGRAN